jgi:glycosyltransferase involved in cell wall biosynthesis
MNKKPKILFLVQLPPPVHGMSMINQYLLQSQAISKEFETKFIDLALSKTISSIGHLSFYKFFRLAFFFPKVILHLFLFRPKAVYFTLSPLGPALYRDIFICLIINVLRIPIVIHMHGKGLSLIPKSSIKNNLVRAAFNDNYVIALSEGLKKDASHLPVREVFAIGNGIEKEKTNPKENLVGREIRFLFLSNLVRSKGIIDLIQAFSFTSISSRNWKLRIVGNNGDITAQELNALIFSKGLQSNIEIVGPRYGLEKANQLDWADALVFPTYYENECFPLVILEAMMHGNAIISTFEGAIPEIVDQGRTGLLVNAQDPSLLSETLNLLINNPEQIKKMGMRAQSDFNTRFTLEIFEKNFVSVLNKCL